MADAAKAYKQAVQFYQEKDFSNAQRILREILTDDPHHAHSLHLMGIIAMDMQRYDIAEELVKTAVAEQDNVPNFYFTLGRILSRQEKKEAAVQHYKKALLLKPDFTDALNNLGTILFSLGRTDEAFEIFARILKSNPQDFNALCNTASILYSKEKLEEALLSYKAALVINPNHAGVYFDIGRTLQSLGKNHEALESFQKALEIEPEHIDALLNVGDIYRDKGALEDALAYYLKITRINPHEDAYAHIAHIYSEQERSRAEVIAVLEEAVKHFPQSVQSLNNLAGIYNKALQYQEAIDCYQRSLALDTNSGKIYADLGTALKNIGRVDESIGMQKKALQILPDAAWIYSNLLLTMVYAASVTPEELAATARTFGENIAAPFLRHRPFINDKNSERKLRVGYISPDFCSHSVSYFLSPIYHCDKKNFEIFAYSNVQKEDDVTSRLKKEFDHWRDIKSLSDDETADLIESDKIDILVDLAGHTASNGLMVLARKPAPIQVTWLGHPTTSGMKAVDYRITDPFAEPIGMTEHLNVETLWRLPEIFCVYQPHEKSPAVIDHPPFEDNGHITFGCFNNFTRVTDPTLVAWAQIMAKTPDSKLLLEVGGVDNKKFKADIEERFVKAGIPLDRVILKPYRNANQYVLYNRIDIALDPFPCVGGTTSMDTLWMGVPFVTLAGNQFLSRIGVSVLTNAGLPELIAQSTEEYVTFVVNLAQDKDRLRAMRHNLRERVAKSPLMDQEKFTRNMESAYRKMWKKWVAN